MYIYIYIYIILRILAVYQNGQLEVDRMNDDCRLQHSFSTIPSVFNSSLAGACSASASELELLSPQFSPAESHLEAPKISKRHQLTMSYTKMVKKNIPSMSAAICWDDMNTTSV